ALYETLVATLEALATGRNAEMTLRHFELRVLDLSGFRPELRSCLGCGAPIEPDANRFGPAGVTCPNCESDAASAPISVNALKILRFLQLSDLPNAQRVRVAPPTLREVESHLRRALRATLERSLKSTDFLDLLRQQTHDTPVDSSRI
ncbi:MAG: DNA repair protein RecO, partial [Dehalococcoidia bacterium]|nr:DNA repair protein RecO [Dehalococcoidia bacterium]